MDNESGDAEAKAGACAYVLHMLLQRLEDTSPGLVQGMLDGTAADRDAAIRAGTMTAPLQRVFQETVEFLEHVHAQNQMRDRASVASSR